MLAAVTAAAQLWHTPVRGFEWVVLCVCKPLWSIGEYFVACGICRMGDL